MGQTETTILSEAEAHAALMEAQETLNSLVAEQTALPQRLESTHDAQQRRPLLARTREIGHLVAKARVTNAHCLIALFDAQIAVAEQQWHEAEEQLPAAEQAQATTQAARDAAHAAAAEAQRQATLAERESENTRSVWHRAQYDALDEDAQGRLREAHFAAGDQASIRQSAHVAAQAAYEEALAAAQEADRGLTAARAAVATAANQVAALQGVKAQAEAALEEHYHMLQQTPAPLVVS